MMKRNTKGTFSAAAFAFAVTLMFTSCGSPIVDTDKVGASDISVLSRLDSSKSGDESKTDAPAESRNDDNSTDADSSTAESKAEKTEGSAPESKKDDPAESAAPKDEPTEGTTVVHLCCAGDNLIHDNIYVEARQDDGTYDFSPCYAPCKKLIEGTDVAILNQETIVNDAFEPSTFPLFSTPTALGDEVVDFGFNVISMSNNHVLDKGSKGLISSLDYWDTKDVVHYGAYRDEADSEDIKTLEVNGITFAFLGYMQHTNGIFLNDGEPGKVVYLEEEDVIKRQIEKADKMADVVVVSCHYGTEIENELNAQQLTLTPKLVEWGADLIIGTQAHALSTCTYMDKPDGGQAFVYYGLGNFFHTMYDNDNPDGHQGKSLVGIFGKMDVVKDYATKEIKFENVKAIPVISHFEGVSWDTMWYNCRVYPYGDYTDELWSKHMMHVRSGLQRSDLQRSINYIPEEFLAYE